MNAPMLTKNGHTKTRGVKCHGRAKVPEVFRPETTANNRTGE